MKKITNFEILINTIVKESKKKTTPKEFAKEIGVDLTLDKAIDMMKKYLKSSNVVESKLGPKTRNLAALAAILAAGFINVIQAQGEPLTVKTPFGVKTYEAKDLKRLSKTDPKTFAIIIEQAAKQQSSYINKVFDRAKGYNVDNPMSSEFKTVKNTENLSDEFGNEGRLISYDDGTKELEGDVLHGGISFRKKLEQRGEIMKGMGPYVEQK
ncbi:MAG: hypothetical protein PHF86_07215 [Candidatus Nanoarchaeia archaeon]|jgi:hypothetical protein|nr:hypothetical protein [Candidatus Nanoarchaeia archaeon]